MDKKLLLTGCFVAATSLLTGCAHKPMDKADPYENFNRAMFGFNMKLDHAVVRPAAKAYNFVTPHVVQTGVTNAFDNLDEITSIPNDALQGKFLFMLNDFWRVFINSTAGIGGLFDVAKHMQLRPHYENFGLTIAYWQKGKVASPYVVLPFLGPGTVRSTVGKVVDLPTIPYFYLPLKYWYVGLSIRAFEGLNYRAQLLPANRMIDTAFDPYIFIRSAYLQTMATRIQANQQESFNAGPISGKQSITVQNLQDANNSSGSADSHASTGITLQNSEEKELLLGTEKK